MDDYSEVFIGMDVSKSRIAVALAEAGRAGEVRFVGEIEADDAAVTKLVRRLSAKRSAPLVAKRELAAPDRPAGAEQARAQRPRMRARARRSVDKDHSRKTNRRDAVSLARLLRAGELTGVWAPDERHEAMRDLSRARSEAAADLRVKRQQTGAFLLRLGRIYPGKKTWGGAHRKWLASQAFAHLEQHIAFEELIQAMEEARARAVRLEKAITEALADWSLAPTVTALMAMRGFDLVAATTLLAETGDLGRFRTPRQLMAWLGLVPSEASTGERVRRFGITKAGNSRARRVLIESAWCYRHPARVGPAKLARVKAAPATAQRIAWKAQTRLAARYRALIKKGKLKTVAVTAVARELTGFVWAIHRALREEPTAA